MTTTTDRDCAENRPDLFNCGNGMCLPVSSRCNSVTECPNGYDEYNCEGITTAPAPRSRPVRVFSVVSLFARPTLSLLFFVSFLLKPITIKDYVFVACLIDLTS